MGANGNRQQTLRSNTVQPYSVGFLNEVNDDKYNVSVYDELNKISVSTNHMFKALDDVNKEITERTKVLDLLNLQTNKSLDKIWAEFGNIKIEMGKGIDISNITGLDGESLGDNLEGILTSIKTVNGRVTQVMGEIQKTNETIQIIQGQVENAQATATEALQVSKSVDGKYSAQWGVKTQVGDLIGGVGFYNDGSTTSFTVNANSFKVYTTNGAAQPAFSINGNTIRLGDNVKIQGAVIDGDIRSKNYVYDPDPAKRQGWAITDTGWATFSSVDISGRVWAFDGSFTGNINANSGYFAGDLRARSGYMDNVTIRESCTILGKLSANNIMGDLTDVSLRNYFYEKRNGGNGFQTTWNVMTIVAADFPRKITFEGKFSISIIPTGSSGTGSWANITVNGSVIWSEGGAGQSYSGSDLSYRTFVMPDAASLGVATGTRVILALTARNEHNGGADISLQLGDWEFPGSGPRHAGNGINFWALKNASVINDVANN